jgi:flagellar basal-body rod protein FlgG
MFKGFYNLTSGMLTHGRHLDVISNNMANVATAGFKADTFTATTFEDVLWSRVGNKEKTYIDLGNQSYITVPSQNYTDYSTGSYDDTGEPLDFAIEGNETCYFAFNTQDGERVYSRAGQFTIDDGGYLHLPGVGRVLDGAGNEIYLLTDKVHGDYFGGIYDDNSNFLGRIGVYRFPEDNQPIKNREALFVANGAEPESVQDVRVINGLVERSNIDLVKQMVGMISEQRAYQSAAQVTKMYDSVMTKATNEIGRM